MVRIEKSQLSELRGASATTIRSNAREIVDAVTKDSTIFDPTAEDRIPRFELDELLLGHVLGRGGFCAVRELNYIKLPESDAPEVKSPIKRLFCCKEKTLNPAMLLEGDNDVINDTDSTTESLSNFGDVGGVPREKLARYVYKKNLKYGTSKYVVKQVNGELEYSDKVAYLKAIVDIELEAKYMTAFNHPNILRIRGLCNPNPNSGETFLILDRLKETLAKRMQDWLRRHRSCKGITGAIVGSKAKREDLLVERLVAAHNIADALDYLHSRNVIFRDCKPDNIGFCTHGRLKLFDFGLAREVQEKDRVAGTELFRLTGFTGAIRYMAPEVGLRKPYNFKADVYSWSQLMWYILELEPPLGVYTPQMFRERVFKRGTRPAVMENWPEHMAALMKRCWSADIDERPDFKGVKEILGVVLLPYNTKKLLPNLFGEPAIAGEKTSQTSNPAASDSSAVPEACGKQQQQQQSHNVIVEDCCEEGSGVQEC